MAKQKKKTVTIKEVKTVTTITHKTFEIPPCYKTQDEIDNYISYGHATPIKEEVVETRTERSFWHRV